MTTDTTNLRGHYDLLSENNVIGWAQDCSRPDYRPTVAVYEGEELLVRGIADNLRPDLISHGIGDGRYGFQLALPKSLFDSRTHQLSILIEDQLNLTPEGILFSAELSEQVSSESQPEADGGREQSTPGFSESIHPDIQAHRNALWDYEQRFVKRELPDLVTLRFERPESPRASIIIPAHNNFPLTWACLTSIQRSQVTASFEVILVDDGSQDETQQLEKKLSGVEIIRHPNPIGFVGSCNEAARIARGECIVLLNNDTQVTDTWLDELLWPFEYWKDTGLVGGQLLHMDGTLQESGAIIWRDGSITQYGNGDNPRHPQYNYTRQVDYASGACLAVPVSLWESLGGLDTAFDPGYYDDVDLAFRARQAGYKTLVAPLCKVFHVEGASSATSSEGGMKRFQALHETKFREHWKKEFAHHHAPEGPLHVEKDRNIEQRALVVDAATPAPDRDAGSYAADHEIRLLQHLGFKVTFAANNLLFGGKYSERLQRMGIEVLYLPYSTSLERILAERGREFSLVYVFRYQVAANIVDDVRRYAPSAKVIMNNVDLHFLREIRSATYTKDKREMESALRTRLAEVDAMRRVDLVATYSKTEHTVILSHLGDEVRLAHAPWVVEIPEEIPSFKQRRDIAFLGNYKHPPNAQAVEFFVKECMPLLRTKLPGVRFLVYGSNMHEGITALACDDVLVPGFVDDVSTVYDSCRVFVAPLQSGAGLKGKVIGALAHGVPCVVSAIAAESIDISNGKDALIAETPEAFVAGVERLYNSESVWKDMSSAAREHVRKRYSAEVGVQMMKQVLRSVGLQPSSRAKNRNAGQ